MFKEKEKPLDKESVKLLWIQLGPSETARRMGLKISTVTAWASRYKWQLDRPAALKPQRGSAGGLNRLSVADVQQTASKALKESLEESATATRSELAAATLQAARNAAAAATAIPVASTSHLKDLAAAAARVFGWDQQQRQGDTYNTLVVTQEQLALIRQLRA